MRCKGTANLEKNLNIWDKKLFILGSFLVNSKEMSNFAARNENNNK